MTASTTAHSISVGNGYHLVVLIMMLAVALLAPAVGAEKPHSVGTKPSILEVVYGHAEDRLSLHARHVPLAMVLQEIAQRADLKIDVPNSDLLRELISIEINYLPLKQAIREILKGFNSAWLYSSATDLPLKNAVPRAVKILLLSKKSAVSEEPQLTGVQEGGPIPAGIEYKPLDMERSAEMEEESDDADISIRKETIAALKHLAPERAMAALVDLLQAPNEDRRIRILAVSGLGEIGGEIAVNHLMQAVYDSDTAVRQAAANELARIGGEKEVGFLLQSLSDEDRALQQTATLALVASNNEQAKAAAAQVMAAQVRAQGQIAEAAIPEHVIEQLVRPEQR